MTSDEAGLKDFLMSYFHQDWDMDGETPDEAITRFLIDRDEALDLRAIVRAIDSLLAEGLADTELSSRLSKQLGCSYYPPGHGQSSHDWLRGVGERVRREISWRE
jgi:hypothetical protein